MSARALGLLLGYAADRVWADPVRHHPVAWFGSVASRLERRVWRDDRLAGTAYAAYANRRRRAETLNIRVQSA